MDGSGDILVKVLCRGDSRQRAFWASRASLNGDDVEEMMQQVPKKTIIVRKKPMRAEWDGDRFIKQVRMS